MKKTSSVFVASLKEKEIHVKGKPCETNVKQGRTPIKFVTELDP